MSFGSNNDSGFRVAIVGGGISGLAAAHRLIESWPETEHRLDLTLFEAADRLGGTIQTTRIDDYLVELGPDSFITNKPWALDLCRRLGIEDRLVATDPQFRRSLVLRKGRPVPVPEGFLLLAPARIWPILKSPLFSPWGKLRMGLEYFLPRRRDDGDESLASFVRRRFGREMLDRIVQPLVGGIYTSDPEQLSLKATMPRFLEMERKHASLIRAARRSLASRQESRRQESGARYGMFTAPQGGLIELLHELEARIAARAEIRFRRPVTAVASQPVAGESAWPGWVVTGKDGVQETFDAVVVALPAYSAADLLRDADGELAGMLREIPYASNAVVVSGHRLEDVRHPLQAFGLVIPHVEQREVIAVSFSSRKFAGRAPEGRVLLRTFVGGAMQPELLERTDEELEATARSELSDMLGVGGVPDFSLISRYRNAMPQYHVGHVEKVDAIEQRVARHAGLALAGNAYRGVGIPDCVHSGEKAAEAVLAHLKSIRAHASADG